MDNDFTPQEQALIERLENTHQRHLSADTKEAIRQRILAQVGMPAPAQSSLSPLNVRRFSVPALAAAAIIAISLAGIVMAQYPKMLNTPSLSTSPATLVTTPTTATSVTTPATMVSSTATIPVVSPNPSQAVAFSIDGVVQDIAANVITVNQTPILLATDDPILKTVHVGDAVHVSGNIDQAGRLFASSIQGGAGGNTSSASIDGVVQAIDNNVVTINGIQIQLPPDYPGLALIKAGTYLSVDGYFRSNGTTMILIVINVTVVPTVQVPTFEKCLTAQPAMGMGDPGMGDPGMGMGEPDAMGEPAMGMAAPPAMGMGDPSIGDPGMGMGEPAMGNDGCS